MNIKHIISRNKLLQNIVLMSSATIIAQLINVLAQPILTRIVPAETLGIYTFLVSMANIAIPVASLKLDMLVVSESDDHQAQLITDTCIVITAIVAILFSFVICCGYLLGFDVFCKYGPIIFTIPLLVFTNGIRFLFISYNNRYRQYKIIGFVGILREGSRAIIQIVSGLLSCGILGQVAGYALAPVLGFGRQTRTYFEKKRNRLYASFDNMRKIVVEGRKQILYLVPAQFVNGFASSLVIIFISVLYSSQQLGYYSAGVRLLEVPLIFIAANVSKVLYKQICEDVSLENKILKKFLTVSFILAIVSATGFGLLFMIAPLFAEFVFGKGYNIAGDYIRCLCLMYSVRLVATSFSGLYTVFEKQKIELYLTIMLIASALAIYVICKKLILPITSFLWLISIAYSILYLFIWFGYFNLCVKHDRRITKNKI